VLECLPEARAMADRVIGVMIVGLCMGIVVAASGGVVFLLAKLALLLYRKLD
jgi:hypothetical protein